MWPEILIAVKLCDHLCTVILRAFFGNVNFFGGPSSTCGKASGKLKQIEVENEEAMMVFLSDVWLDQVKVIWWHYLVV